MQNCNSSAGTTVKQSSKSSLLFRQPCILAMLLLCAVFCQGQNKEIGSETMKETTSGNGMNIPHGQFNILIGNGAGKYITNESYCIIVGHNKLAVNSKGKDMIWLVDWNEPYLKSNLDIKIILLNYYNSFIKTKKDSKNYRVGLALRIINRNNVPIGKDARVLQ